MITHSVLLTGVSAALYLRWQQRNRRGTYSTSSLNKSYNAACQDQRSRDIILSLSLGAVSNSDVGGHGSPLFPVSCSFDDLDFTDFQQLAEAFHEVQPWSSSASLALNFPSDYDVLKSMLSHDMSQETHLPRSDSVHQFPHTMHVFYIH